MMPVVNGFSCDNDVVAGAVGGLNGGEGQGDFNDLLRDELNGLDQLRDVCLSEGTSHEWNINVLYGIDIPDEIRERVAQQTIPSLVNLREELNQLNDQLQGLDEDVEETTGDFDDDDRMITEEDLVSQIDYMIQELKEKKGKLSGSVFKIESYLGEEKTSSSTSSKCSLSTTTSTLSSMSSSLPDKTLVLEDSFVKCLTDLNMALEKVTQITEGIAHLPLHDPDSSPNGQQH